MDKKFPKQIPIFPLSGVIYFPRTNVPLNIFEERYLDLVNDSFRNDKLMGMVQSKRENSLVYRVGCLGKISDYQETSDGRVLINLTGITRFEITKEIASKKNIENLRWTMKNLIKIWLYQVKLRQFMINLILWKKLKNSLKRMD